MKLSRNQLKARHLGLVGVLITGLVAGTTVVTSGLGTGVNASIPSGYILLPRDTLLALPMSGTAWTNLKAWADKPVSEPSLSDQDDNDDITALAKAIVYARTGTEKYRTDAVTMLKLAVGTEGEPGDTLGIARNTLPLVLAADFAGWRDATWSAWLASLRTFVNPDRDYTLISIHEKRPNNWGTHAGAGRIAIDLYLGDTADLARAASVFHGYLGNRSSYASFIYGDDLTWQASSSAPVGVNGAGATKNGVNIDGILPDDMRRGGSFPTVGATGASYTWEALQGALMQAELLSRSGFDAYGWEASALKRAYQRINALGYPAAGDDLWQPFLVDLRYGTHLAVTASRPGKNMGFTDWLYQLGTGPVVTPGPTPTPSRTPTPAPTPSPTVAPSPTPSPTASPSGGPTPSASSSPSPSLTIDERLNAIEDVLVDIVERLEALESAAP